MRRLFAALALVAACSSPNGGPKTAPLQLEPPGAFPSLVTAETFSATGSAASAGGSDAARRQRPIQPLSPAGKEAPREGGEVPGKEDPSLAWSDHRARLKPAETAVLERLEAAWKADPLRWPELARLLQFLLALDRPVAADRFLAEHRALERYDGRDHDLNLVLAQLDRRLGRPESASERLMRALEADRALLPLRIARAFFYDADIPAFGLAKKRPSSRFQAGKPFRLYLEVENFVLSAAGPEQYNVRFKIQLRLLSAGKNPVPWPRWLEAQEVSSPSFHSRVRDVWVPVNDSFPGEIPAGDYELIVELVDLNKKEHERTVARIPFQIAPR